MARRRVTEDQLALFREDESPPAVRVAEVEPRARALAEEVPEVIRLGGSTWSFPGWAGLVYDKEYPVAALARDGLAAYARHPLLRMVGVDRTFYKPMTVAEHAAYAAAVPAGFRFLVKAHEALTILRYPDHDRYGERRGEVSPLYLDAAYAAEEVVAPTVAGLGEKLGAILFQFPPGAAEVPEAFASRLGDFLAKLPRGPIYTVELRNRAHLTQRYAEAVRAAGACHCYNVFPGMPDLEAQARIAGGPGPLFVLRWVVRRGLAYAEARTRFAPFHQLADPDPATRRTLAAMALRAARRGTPSLLSIHNLAEGSTPPSIVELAEEVVRQGRQGKAETGDSLAEPG